MNERSKIRVLAEVAGINMKLYGYPTDEELFIILKNKLLTDNQINNGWSLPLEKEPAEGLLISMALRANHALGMPTHIDSLSEMMNFGREGRAQTVKKEIEYAKLFYYELYNQAKEVNLYNRTSGIKIPVKADVQLLFEVALQLDPDFIKRDYKSKDNLLGVYTKYYEEVVGLGFYSKEHDETYRNLLK